MPHSTTVIPPSSTISLLLLFLLAAFAAPVARAAVLQRQQQSKCVWPVSDTLFIVDSTLGIAPYDHVQETRFIEKVLGTMRITSNQTRIALAQFTPQPRHEFSLASEGGENAVAAVQRLQFVGCDSATDRNRCEPTASVNSIAAFSLKEGNRKTIPDVIVVISSSKWPIPELRPKETLLPPISPIHAFYILVGTNSAPQRRFEPAATSISLTAVDFTALDDLVQPLCRSVNDFVFYGSNPGNGNQPPFNNTHGNGFHTRQPIYGTTTRPDLSIPWNYFSPLAWTITALLVLLFFIILLALGLAVWQYKDENKRLQRRILESEHKMKQQNEYFTGKLHKQMEAEIAARDKFDEELRKTEEKHAHHAERLERRLEKHLETSHLPAPAPVPAPAPAPPQPAPIIILGTGTGSGGANHGTTQALLEYARLTGARVVLPQGMSGRPTQGIAIGEPHPSAPQATEIRVPADPTPVALETPILSPPSAPVSKRTSLASKASTKLSNKSEPIPTHRNRPQRPPLFH